MAEWKELGNKAKNLTLAGLGKARDLGGKRQAEPGQRLGRGKQEEDLRGDRQTLFGGESHRPRRL